MSKNRILQVKEVTIKIINQNETDYISLTDMTSNFNEGSGLIGKWITNKNTLEYLGVWENIKNDNFNYPEFGVIKDESGVNRFVMSVGQWVNRTKAIGMIVKAGRYGGTFAHKDIAFHFAMWVSPEFQIYLINEFQRLKDEENNRSQLEWNLQRTLAKVNYQIHTDSIKEKLIPNEITKKQTSFIYANEADLLNVALFGITAKEWRESNPNKKGNIRDYTTLDQLVVLSNMESINALLISLCKKTSNIALCLFVITVIYKYKLLTIKNLTSLIFDSFLSKTYRCYVFLQRLIRQNILQKERLIQLNQVAITQMKSLLKYNSRKKNKITNNAL